MRYFLALLGLTLFFLSSCTPSKAVLEVNRDSITLTNASSVGAFTVTNDSEEDSDLQWKVTASSGLVALDPAEGSLMSGQSKGVRVTVDNRTFRKGDVFSATVTVRSNGGTHRLDVTYEMEVDGLLACGTPADKPLTSENRQPSVSTPYAPGELLVGYRTATPSSSIGATSLRAHTLELSRLGRAVATDFGLNVLKPATLRRPALVELPSGEDVTAAAQRLVRDPRVAYAEPNYFLQPLELNDPRYSEQWSLLEFGLPQAWEIAIGTTPIVVAILDNGFDLNHEDFTDKMLPGCDFFNNDNDPQAGRNNNGHGTHVAGIAAAVGNNAKGIVGVAYGPGVKLLPVKVLPDVGNGTVSRLLDAMLWAAGLEGSGAAPNPNPADIISISLGIPPKDLKGDLPQSVETTARQVYEAGVFVVAASGNSSSSDAIFSPANSEWISAAGSVDADYRRSSFSNYAQTGPSVDFMAPGGVLEGQGVLSTTLDNGYNRLTGTSMSTPFVAGAAALLLSQAPGLSPEMLKAKLTASALFDETYMTQEAYGAGVICVDKALGAATQCGRP